MDKNYDSILVEDKVLILYILKSIQRCMTDNGLYKIISAIKEINYFYFSDILEDLVKSNLVGSYTREDKKVYEITSNGINSLELTLDALPGLIKLKADNRLKDELINVEEESSIIVEYIPENEKDYTVKCKIVEKNRTIFEIKTFAGSNERAKHIANNWKQNAYTIYPKILDLLDN